MSVSSASLSLSLAGASSQPSGADTVLSRNVQGKRVIELFLSVSICKLACTCKFALTTQFEESGEKDHDPAPEIVAYALTRSFSHASHRSGHDSSSPIAVDMVTGVSLFAGLDYWTGLLDSRNFMQKR